MKLPGKIFLMALPIAFGLSIFSSCQAKTGNKDNVENSDQIISTSAPPGRVDTTKILKEKVLIDFIATAKTIKPNPKNGVPFDKLDYDKVIAYDFAGSEETYPGVIDEKGKFVPVVLGQQFLAQDQANKILSTLA
ncbi:MAG TPA: hypothetical protein VLR49_00370, partial [Ferruginibacter sp.]|nr:hypothetical protein [Ferruginibacter sp.]